MSATAPTQIDPTSVALSNNPRGVGLLTLCIALSVLATVAVGLRLWARKFQGSRFASEDYVIIFALFGLYGNAIAECFAVIWGGRGLHQNLITLAELEVNLKTLMAAQVSWTFCTSAIKISLLLLYARVFPGKNFKMITYFFIGVVVAYCAGCLIFFMANCRPFEAQFTPWVPGVTCGNTHDGWLLTGLANILTDIAILSLPMRSVWNLQLPRRTKLAVSVVFGLGFITLAVSIVRIVSLFQVNQMDLTYTSVVPDVLSAVEPFLMIVCACIPIMRPLFKRFFPTNDASNMQQQWTPRKNIQQQQQWTPRRNAPYARPQMAAANISRPLINKQLPAIKETPAPEYKPYRPEHTSRHYSREDDEKILIRDAEWKQTFLSRASTPSPPAPLQRPSRPHDPSRGIAVTTDIHVFRN